MPDIVTPTMVICRQSATAEEIERARAEYGSEDIEIDDDAAHSPAPDDCGVWVQAWVWIGTPGDPVEIDHVGAHLATVLPDSQGG